MWGGERKIQFKLVLNWTFSLLKNQRDEWKVIMLSRWVKVIKEKRWIAGCCWRPFAHGDQFSSCKQSQARGKWKQDRCLEKWWQVTDKQIVSWHRFKGHQVYPHRYKQRTVIVLVTIWCTENRTCVLECRGNSKTPVKVDESRRKKKVISSFTSS